MTNWTATCVEVFDCEARVVVPSIDILKILDTPNAHKARMRIEESKQKGIAKYSCPLCAQTLSLRGGLQSKFVMHFAHPRMPEHKCPYKTSDNHTPDELAAMKYNGLKETAEHRLVKARLLRALRMDAGVEPDSLYSEKIYRAKLPDKSWRRPDVAARWNGKSIVFEAQLSSTFVTVIANRRNFYTENGVELIWIFAHRPNLDTGFMPFTGKDIFYNNNFNLFVVNSDTDAESLKRNKLVIEAWWPDPTTFSLEQPSNDWCSQPVTLDQLTFNHEKRVVFYFDFEAAMIKKQQQEKIQKIAFENKHKDNLVVDDRVPPGTSADFNFQQERAITAWPGSQRLEPDFEKLTFAIQNRSIEIIWQQLRNVITGDSRLNLLEVFKAFAKCGLIVIDSYSERERAFHFKAILSALYSLAAGVPIGNGYKNLKEIENWIYASHTCHYSLFLRAVKTFGRENAIDATNKRSTTGKHIEEFRTMRKLPGRSVVKFDQDRSLDAIIHVTFPDLMSDLELLKRFNARRLLAINGVIS